MRFVIGTSLACTAVAVGLTAWAWPSLPDPMPTHFGPGGQADAWGPRWQAVIVGPLLCLLPMVLTPLLRLDPRRADIERSGPAVKLVMGALSAFGVVLQAAILGAATRPGQALDERLFLGGLGLLFVGIGLAMPRIRSNYMFGIRTPWTLADEEVWRRTHRVGGGSFVVGGLIAMGVPWLVQGPWRVGVAVGAILVAALVPVVFSYVAWRRRDMPGAP